MSTRLILGCIVVLGMVANGFSRQMPRGVANTPGSTESAGAVQQRLLNNVATFETIVRKAEQEQTTGLPMARLYWQLGMSYEDAGEIGRAEATLQHAEALFRQSDNNGGELAEALDSLAVLDGAIGRVPEAMKEELEALQLRQKLGDRLLMARSWNTLGALALKQKKFDQARAFSQKAADEFEENKNATFNDKLAARYGLGMALCGQKDYADAVSVLKNAVTDARSTPSVEPIPIGIGEFLLGYAYWHSGDAADAGVEMKSGVNTLNAQLGWGAPSYVLVLKIYAKYLHQTRNVEEASEVDRRIQQAESVVSVGALQSSAGVFGFDSLR